MALQLTDWRERWAVRLADAGLAVARPLVARRRPVPAVGDRPSVLLLRLERVGDLLMTLDAIAAVRAVRPGASIDLVVGEWNEAVARLIPAVDRVETLSAPWLARGAGGHPPAAMVARAWSWRARRYDVAINFEGDVRSNALLGLSGAVRRVGFPMAGGGPMLSDAVAFDPTIHTRSSSLRLVERAFDLAPGSLEQQRPAAGVRRLRLPEDARRRAADLLAPAAAGSPIIVVHGGGGRDIKQWHLDRFGDVATRLAREFGATVVLSGGAEDRAVVDVVTAHLASDVPRVDLCGRVDLVVLAAVLDRASLIVTGDTGPMHLAAALDRPIVAVFGPSDPRRWGPASDRARVVRVDLACSPCNRIRRPPERCRGHVPDCLAAISADQVYQEAARLLGAPV
jgi:lipopolysaccharide heptosyltransferase II